MMPRKLTKQEALEIYSIDIDNVDAIIDDATVELAEYVGSILASKNIDKSAKLTECFNSFGNYLKANIVTPLRKATEPRADDDIQRTNTENDDDKLSPKLRAMVAAMVAAEPRLSEQEHLNYLLHSPRGRRLAEHLNSLTKGQPMNRSEEMQEMRKFVKQGGMASINKRII